MAHGLGAPLNSLCRRQVGPIYTLSVLFYLSSISSFFSLITDKSKIDEYAPSKMKILPSSLTLKIRDVNVDRGNN
jgi:hypothetical protein